MEKIRIRRAGIKDDSQNKTGRSQRRDTNDMPNEMSPENSAEQSREDGWPKIPPLTKLQGLLARNKLTPKYQLVGTEGDSFEPVFTYQVLINNEYITNATGKSKKEAKNMACLKLLDYLTGTGSYSTDSNDHSLINDPDEEDLLNNPIGALQELCMSKRWPPPCYKMQEIVGLPHERVFTIACNVLDKSQIGYGKSKKLAKRDAGQKMYQHLIGANAHNGKNVGHEEKKIDKRSNKISELHRNMKGTTGPKTTILHMTTINSHTDYTQLLEELAEELSFNITFVDIEEMSKGNLFQCLVQLSTQPVAVCYGSALTFDDARVSAVRNAIEYLKVMTKCDVKQPVN